MAWDAEDLEAWEQKKERGGILPNEDLVLEYSGLGG